MTPSVKFYISPGGILLGDVRVPGDKSISHRALILGALAEGTTWVRGFLEGEDTLATIKAFRSMGVPIQGPEAGKVEIQGVGLDGLEPPSSSLELGNSGTSMRLLSGLLAGQRFNSILSGDQSLNRRPMQRITEPLNRMGARIETSAEGMAPLHIFGNQPLSCIDYKMPIGSAQVKSGLLLAGLYAQGTTCIREPVATRDHTERMLLGFSYPVRTKGNCICLDGGGRLLATKLDVPADISSAAFFMVGASIASGSDVTFRYVGINPTRTGVIHILRLMGARIEISNQRIVGGEQVADVRVWSSPLKGIRIPEPLVAPAIDEFPALFVAAACADGETVLTGARELRVKESDRIETMADGLSTLGVEVKATDDTMIVKGGALSGGEIHSRGDHRVAMAFSIAGLRASGKITLTDCANVETSFPGFAKLASSLGLRITSKESTR